VGAHADYESRYGSTAEVAVTHWGEGEGFAPQTTTAEEFEDVWTSARAQIPNVPSSPVRRWPTARESPYAWLVAVL
jgi:hypothetical protein